MYAHTCKSWISPVSNRTYLNILDMMNSPGKVTHPVRRAKSHKGNETLVIDHLIYISHYKLIVYFVFTSHETVARIINGVRFMAHPCIFIYRE